MRLDTVIENIERARLSVSPHHIVKLVAVSKSVGTSAVRSLYEQGQRAFGENRVQDMASKCRALDALPLEWHFIGRLQSNKINALLDLDPFLIHSVDSLDVARAIDERAGRRGVRPRILLQINAACEVTKAGVDPREAADVYAAIAQSCPNLLLDGVMTIGAHTEDRQSVQKSFETTRAIFDRLAPFAPSVCSMGMSGDYDLAIRCGSTMVRIGSALFE